MSNLSSMKSNPPVSPMHHKSRLERDSELEELRKMRITKHLKREKSMEIEVLEEKYRNEQTKRSKYNLHSIYHVVLQLIFLTRRFFSILYRSTICFSVYEEKSIIYTHPGSLGNATKSKSRGRTKKKN